MISTIGFVELVVSPDVLERCELGSDELTRSLTQANSLKSIGAKSISARVLMRESNMEAKNLRPVLRSEVEHSLLSQEMQEERELVDKVLNGDRDSFRLLFEKYYPRILAAATRILGNASDGADLTQEAFLKAYKNLKSFQGNSSFYTWVYRILVNACIDLKRKSSSKNEIPTSEDYILTGDGSDPIMAPFHAMQWSQEDKVYAKELRAIIGSALNELTPAHREIIIQREVEGLSYEEISKLLNCSLGTVMSRLFHARKKLVSILELRMGMKAKSSSKNEYKNISVA